jgi:hypothetical protein
VDLTTGEAIGRRLGHFLASLALLPKAIQETLDFGVQAGGKSFGQVGSTSAVASRTYLGSIGEGTRVLARLRMRKDRNFCVGIIKFSNLPWKRTRIIRMLEHDFGPRRGQVGRVKRPVGKD